MLPKKLKKKIFKDKRGYLLEIIPTKMQKNLFIVFLQSKKKVIRGMHFNKKLDEEKLVVILDGRILDVTINLNKGKNFGKIFYFKLKKNDILFIPKGYAHGYLCYGKKNLVLYLLNKKFSKFFLKIIQVLFGMIKNLILNGILKSLFYQIKIELT